MNARRACLLLALVALIVLDSRIQRTRSAHFALDFFQYWAVPAAQRLSGGLVGTPYLTRRPGDRRPGDRYPTYRLVLDAYVTKRAAEPDAQMLADGWRRRQRGLFLNQSPLFYMAASALPHDYVQAQTLFRGLLLLASTAALLLLARPLGFGRLELGVAGLALPAGFWPATNDLDVGNTNALGLLALVVLCRLARVAQPGSGFAPATLAVTGAGVYCLLKPSSPLPALAIAVSALWRLGPRRGLRSWLFALLLVVPLVPLSAWWLGTDPLWTDFVRLNSRSADSMATLDLNSAANDPMGRGLGPVGRRAALALLLGATFAAGLLRGAGPRAAERLAVAMRDPAWLGSVALCVNLALWPLFWVHYNVLLLLPIVVLAADRRSGQAAALLSFVMPCVQAVWPEVPEGDALQSLAFVPVWLELVRPGRLQRLAPTRFSET